MGSWDFWVSGTQAPLFCCCVLLNMVKDDCSNSRNLVYIPARRKLGGEEKLQEGCQLIFERGPLRNWWLPPVLHHMGQTCLLWEQQGKCFCQPTKHHLRVINFNSWENGSVGKMRRFWHDRECPASVALLSVVCAACLLCLPEKSVIIPSSPALVTFDPYQPFSRHCSPSMRCLT